MTEPGGSEEASHRQITPLQTSLLGATVLCAGAVLTATTHYTSTAKKLAEEGIAPAVRRKAFPVAAQALGVSTVLCAAMGGAALVSWHFLGLESRNVAEVATFSDAVVLAKQQRVRKKERPRWSFSMLLDSFNSLFFDSLMMITCSFHSFAGYG